MKRAEFLVKEPYMATWLVGNKLESRVFGEGTLHGYTAGMPTFIALMSSSLSRFVIGGHGQG
jgi:hypothetical protein